MPLEPHSKLLSPMPNQVICRYMDFWKLETILSRGLYLSRLTNQQDKMEGRYPKNYWALGDRLAQLKWRLIEQFGPSERVDQLTSFFVQRTRDSRLAELERRKFFATYFCGVSTELPYMWRDYVGEVEHGVCIRTTCKALAAALNSEERKAYLSHVIYHTPEEDLPFWNGLQRGILKRRDPYFQESEIRLLFWDPMLENSAEDSVILKIDPRILIQELVISPLSDEVFASKVTGIIERMGFNTSVIKKSNLTADDILVSRPRKLS